MVTIFIAALLHCSGLVCQASEDAALVAEFKRYYDLDRSETQRFEAVSVLVGIDSLGAAKALVLALEDPSFAVRKAAIDALAAHTKVETAQWLAEEVLENRKNKKKTLLRASVASALGGIGQGEIYGPLSAMLEEKDVLVQLAAIDGLGRLKDSRACHDLSMVASEGDVVVSVAALDALVAIGHKEGAVEAVVKGLSHEEWQVRARSIEAVVDLRLKEGISGLIDRMGLEEGRLLGDAYGALKSMTLRDFQDKPEPWRTWWDRNEEKWILPDYATIEAARKKEDAEGTRYAGGKNAFVGVETKSDAIMFVIDVSDSMATPFGDPERLKALGRTYSSLQRLAIVKEELILTIDGLSDDTSFNIMSFATDVDLWKKGLVKANVLNRNNAKSWVEKLRPKGGAGASFRARAGLVDLQSAEGQTNTHLALMMALGEDVVEEEDKRRPQTLRVKAPRSALDTIFFLTDGEPTVGKFVDMLKIRQDVQRLNAYLGIQIHVIYVGAFGGEDFKVLAEENDGFFVSIGG